MPPPEGQPNDGEPKLTEAKPSKPTVIAPSRHYKAEHAADFFTWLATVPSTEWSHLTLYLYRLWPVIVRNPKFIDKYGTPITADNILHRFGAGRYQLILSDSNKGKFGEVSDCVVALHNNNWDQYPPILDEGELDQGNRENQGYISWRKSKGVDPVAQNPAPQTNDEIVKLLIGEIRSMRAEMQQQRGSAYDPETDAFKSAINTMDLANRKVVEMNAGQNNPLSVLELLEKAKGLTGGGENSNNQLMMLFMTKLMERAFAPPPPAMGVKDLLEAVALVDDLRGGKSESSGGLFEAAINKLPDALREIGTIMAFANRPGPAQTAPPATRVVEHAAAPVPNPVHPLPQTPPQEAPPMTITPDHLKLILGQAGGHILRALEDNESGVDFAEFVDKMSSPAYDTAKSMGKAGILEALKSHADLWARLAPRQAQLDTFIDEFLTAFDEPQEPEPEAAAGIQ